MKVRKQTVPTMLEQLTTFRDQGKAVPWSRMCDVLRDVDKQQYEPLCLEVEISAGAQKIIEEVGRSRAQHGLAMRPLGCADTKQKLAQIDAPWSKRLLTKVNALCGE